MAEKLLEVMRWIIQTRHYSYHVKSQDSHTSQPLMIPDLIIDANQVCGKLLVDLAGCATAYPAYLVASIVCRICVICGSVITSLALQDAGCALLIRSTGCVK